MNRIQKYILIFLSIVVGLLPLLSLGQFSYSEHYSEKDGLPSSKIYDMLEDSHQQMWFATENGISRFDGYSFTNFLHENGLPSNSMIKLYEDYKGRIWFLSYKGELSYFENDSIHLHWLSPIIQKEGLRITDHIFVDTLDNVFLCGLYGGWLYGKTSDQSYTYYLSKSSQSPYRYTIFYSSDPKKNIIGFFYNDKDSNGALTKVYPDLTTFQITNDKFYTYLQKEKLSINHQNGLFTLGPVLMAYKTDSIFKVKTFGSNITNLAQDKAGNLWISVEFEGIYYYPKGDLQTQPKLYFPNLTLSNMVEDHEGNHWFSSTENGVYMVPGIQFKTYFKSEMETYSDRIIAMEHDEDRLYFSTGNRGIFSGQMSNGAFRIDKDFQPEGEKTTNAKDIIISQDGSIWITGGEYIRFNKQGQHIPVFGQKKYSGYGFFKLEEGKLALAIKTGFAIFDLSGRQISESGENFPEHTFVISAINDSNMLLGTLNGLFQMKNGLYSKINTPEIFSQRISSIKRIDSTQWIGTFDYGLAIRMPDTTYFLTQKDGLAGNRIKTIFAESENRIWVGTSTGLSLVDWHPNEKNQPYSITNFSIWDGLPSDEINDIVKFKDLLWLGTSKGLVSFDPHTLKLNKELPGMLFENIRINNSEINQVERTSSFKHYENNFTFNFRAATFRNANHIKFLYRLEGLEDEWIETSNHSIRYPALESGEYTFEVKAELYNGETTGAIQYPFKIRKYFADTFVFKTVIILLIILLCTSLVINYNKVRNQRRKLERQILLAEQNAVRAQMNPHFIFNSLNSIQNFILDNDAKNANLYLVIFSSLIRKILEASKRNFISLREEIETIKLYLELEKFRFENQFEYSINIHTKVNADQLAIPSMILQPYLENAIWHGLVPKKEKGLLELNIKETENGLILISVSDNGIGREKAAEISKRRKHHKPTGMKNVEERLNLLNKMNDTHLVVEVIDLYDNDSQACGTRVEFIIDV